MGTSSDNLLERAACGDRPALVDLLKRHGSSVRRSLAGRIPERWRSLLSDDDVMQQAYADAVAKIGQFDSRSEAAFVKWLTTIAQRNLGDALKLLEAEKRGGDRRPILPKSADDSFVALHEMLTGTGTTPSGQAARREARSALERAIEQLPEAYARVVVLYDLEDRPVQEVAEAMERSPGAVFMLRARAHERLHELMGRTSKFFSG